MPKKIDSYASHTEKLIILFSRLYFSKESHSLTELSRMLNCSKQTVSRLVDGIRKAYKVDIDEFKRGKKKFYRFTKQEKMIPILNLTEVEISILQMCKAFSEHLLGKRFITEASHAIEKSLAQLPDGKTVSSGHYSSFQPGTIDYTPYQEIIRDLISAMESKRVCKVSYKRIKANRAKTFYIKPLKIFSHKDTIYLNARMARQPGRPYRKPDFDPLMAIHRITKLELTERKFDFPDDYDFEKIYKQNFGVIKGEPFKVEIEFWGWAAKFASERIFSPDQKLTRKRNGNIKLKFTATSDYELISWILSFREQAKLLKPKWLVDELTGKIEKIVEVYN